MIMILLKDMKAISSSNLTTYALVIADLLDEVLRNYADAIVTDIDLTNMSNLVLLDNKEESLMTSVSSESSLSNVNYTKFFSKDNPIFNYADYETTKALVAEIKNIFQKYLKSSGVDTKQSAIIEVISKLEKDLKKLGDIINKKDSPAEIMELVHIQIHPSLQTGFELQTNKNMIRQMDMNG
jgi:hypothetical protein